MEHKENNEVEIDLGEIFAVLMSRLAIIIASTIICGVIAFSYAKFMITPVYDSTTQIYVLSQTDGSSTVTYNDLVTGTQLTKDYSVLIKSRTVLEEVIKELDLDMEYGQLQGMVTVTTETDTRVIGITVQDIDPGRAKTIADKVRELASDHIAEVMDSSAVKVVDEANLPGEPSGPNVIKYMAIGLVLGFVLAVGIILIIYLTNDKIKTPEDIEKYLGISTLGSIPVDESMVENTKKKSKKKNNTGKKR